MVGCRMHFFDVVQAIALDFASWRRTCKLIPSQTASARSSMDRASDYGSEGWGFESLRARSGPPQCDPPVGVLHFYQALLRECFFMPIRLWCSQRLGFLFDPRWRSPGRRRASLVARQNSPGTVPSETPRDKVRPARRKWDVLDHSHAGQRVSVQSIGSAVRIMSSPASMRTMTDTTVPKT